MIQSSPQLQLIQKIGVGVNTIDLEAAKARGIAVCNMPGINSRAVAEMTLGFMLAAARRLTQIGPDLRAGQWVVDEPLQEKLFELHGKTVGLIGSGSVPRMLAPWLVAMGVRVVYHGRSLAAQFDHPRLALTDLLAQSDIVSVHLPLTPETRGMFDKEAFARMKPGAVFINTARGELVEEAALGAALDSGRLSLACLDVFASEPIDPDHPLVKRRDVIATPHTAWLTQDMFHRALSLALENSQRLVDHQPLRHRVV
jgi:phosphoglycerate dehydrogenase-like enzyme